MRALPPLLLLVAALSCGPRTTTLTPTSPIPPAPQPGPTLRQPRESHFGTLIQLTRGGENAEAYWSSDGRSLIFQSTRPPYECDQIFTMSLDGAEPRLISSGEGRTTCPYFFPGGKTLLYSSTHL